MWDPQSVSAGSIMPAYKWLFDNKKADYSRDSEKNEGMVKLGVPYSLQDIANAHYSYSATNSRD